MSHACDDDHMNANTRTRVLRSEMMRRMNDGWTVVERNTFDMVMVHDVPPPWWRVALDVLSPLSWFGGIPTYAQVHRWLHVTVNEALTLSRFTTGAVPPAWQRAFTWEVPDGESRSDTAH